MFCLCNKFCQKKCLAKCNFVVAFCDGTPCRLRRVAVHGLSLAQAGESEEPICACAPSPRSMLFQGGAATLTGPAVWRVCPGIADTDYWSLWIYAPKKEWLIGVVQEHAEENPDKFLGVQRCNPSLWGQNRRLAQCLEIRTYVTKDLTVITGTALTGTVITETDISDQINRFSI